MTFRRFRRRQSAIPDTRARSFPSETVVQAGEPTFRSSRRLPRRESSNASGIDFYGGYGAPSPMSLPIFIRRPVRPMQRPQPALSNRPLPAYPVIADWRAMRKVEAPPAVKFCVSRGIRREVLFANRIAGYRRSPGAGGSYRRLRSSNVSC